MQIDAIIIAGGQPAANAPKYNLNGDKPKALLPICGKPMIVWVIDALHAAQSIDAIVVVGLEMPDLSPHPCAWLADAGSIVRNGFAGAAWLKHHRPQQTVALMITADVPAISADSIDRWVAQCDFRQPAATYSFVAAETLEDTFPNSDRTYFSLRDGRYSGGNIACIHRDAVATNHALWESATAGRKDAWKIAKLVGWRTVLRLLTRRLTIADVEQTATRMLGLPCHIIVSDDATIGMDIDKVHQIDQLTTFIRQRESSC